MLDLLGTLVFAISGVMAAKEHNFDLVGAIVLAFVTALGGGTLRDVLIGQTPVAWMNDINYLIVVFLSLPICYIALDLIGRLRRSLFLFDTMLGSNDNMGTSESFIDTPGFWVDNKVFGRDWFEFTQSIGLFICIALFICY